MCISVCLRHYRCSNVFGLLRFVQLNSVGLDLHRLYAYLTLSIVFLYSVKPGIDPAHVTTVGTVSSIAFWIVIVM
jgi:hypothetical protein